MSNWKPARVFISFVVFNSLIPYENEAEKFIIAQYKSPEETLLCPAMYVCLDLALLM